MTIPTLSQGGMERVMTEIANYAVNEGFNVTIICFFKSEIKYPLEKGVTVLFPENDYSGDLQGKYKTIRYLYQSLRMLSPDVVLSFGEIFNSICVVVCKVLGYRVYISDRSSPFVSQGKINDFLKSHIYPYADGVIAQTDLAKSVFTDKGYNKNIITIANPLKKINNDLKDATIIEEQKVIVSVGRIVESKNHADLIRMFSQINKHDWKLYIVGGGPLLEYCRTLIKSLDLENNVFMIGPSDDVDSLLSKADIFAYSSISEGFPNALSEAMAFPLTCIAYDCVAGPSDIIISGYNGVLIPLNDRELFLKELQTLMEDRDLRMMLRKNARDNAQKFSITTIGKKYLNFLSSHC